MIEYFASRGAKVKDVAFADLPTTEKNKRLASTLDGWTDAGLLKRVTSMR